MVKTWYAYIGNDEFLCPHCGGVVLDTKMHQDWHKITGTLMQEGER